MAQETLKQVAEDFKKVDPAILEAEDLISAMKEAGEPTSQQESDLRKLKIRRDKWARMLKARGLL